MPLGGGQNAVKYKVFYRAGGLAAEDDLPLGGDYPAAEGDLRQFLSPGKNPVFRRLHIWGIILLQPLVLFTPNTAFGFLLDFHPIVLILFTRIYIYIHIYNIIRVLT